MRGGSFYLTGNQLHWLAGLLEAEGSFVTGSPTEPRTPKLVISMTDQDVIQAVANLLGATVIQCKRGTHLKKIYRTGLRGGSAVSLMRLMQPLMGIRRQQQIEHAVACHNLTNSYPCRVFHQVDDIVAEHERYWLAGYMEGEGSFSVHTDARPHRTYYYPILQVNSTDKDVIERVRMLWRTYIQAEIRIGSYQPAYPGSKINYHISIKGTRAQPIMNSLYPLLFARRQAQICTMLATAGHRD